MDPEHDLHLRAPAGAAAPHLPLRADDRGRPHGLRQDDGRELVSRRAGEGRGRDCGAHQRLFRPSGHLLEERAGRIRTRRAAAAARLRLPGRRRRCEPAGGRSLPRAGRARERVHLHRRFSPPDRRAHHGVFMCTRQPPAGERAPDRGEPRPLPPRRRRRAAGQPGLPDRGRASAAQPHGAVHLCAPLRHGPDRRASRNAAACERGVVFGRVPEPAHALRARRAAGPALGHLHHVFRRHDRAALTPAAGVSGRHGAGG